MRPASCALRTRTSKRRRGVRGDRAPHERTKPHRAYGRPPTVPHRTSGRPPAVPYRTSGRPPTARTDHAAPAPIETVISLEFDAPGHPNIYLITPYEVLIAEDGRLELMVNGASRIIGIQRLHLKEDVGKRLHEGTLASAQAILVGYNRSGVPLMETVSRPVLR